MAHYGMLKESHHRNGDCNVPKRYNPALENRVLSQRKQYKEMKNGGTMMDRERVDMLEHPGFAWSCKDGRTTNTSGKDRRTNM
jgi:hypothetical protein